MKTLRPSGQLGTKILYNHIVPNPFIAADTSVLCRKQGGKSQ